MYLFIRIQFDITYHVPPLFFSSPIWTVLKTFMPFRSLLKYHCLWEAFPQHIPKSKLIVAFSCSGSFIAHLTLLFISFLVLFLHRNSLPLVLPPPARCLQHRWRIFCHFLFCFCFGFQDNASSCRIYPWNNSQLLLFIITIIVTLFAYPLIDS